MLHIAADMGEESGVKSTEGQEEGGDSRPPLFEDTLADYQPPKRYVKEERKETSKAPKVMIMVGGASFTTSPPTSAHWHYTVFHMLSCTYMFLCLFYSLLDFEITYNWLCFFS